MRRKLWLSDETSILFLARSKTMTATRSTRGGKKDAKDTQMELDESVQEVKKHREDIELLSQRMAAVEERTYNLSATMKYVQEQHKQDVGKLMEVVTTMKQRLSEVERHGRRLFKTLRNQLRSERGVDADTQKEKADVQREDREMEFVSHIDKEVQDARMRHRDDEVSPPSIDRGTRSTCPASQSPPSSDRDGVRCLQDAYARLQRPSCRLSATRGTVV